VWTPEKATRQRSTALARQPEFDGLIDFDQVLRTAQPSRLLPAYDRGPHPPERPGNQAMVDAAPLRLLGQETHRGGGRPRRSAAIPAEEPWTSNRS
jgi:hypothetical protein